MAFTRKQFLKTAAVLLSIYPLKLFFDAGRTASRAGAQQLKQIVPLDLPEGVSFHHDVIAFRNGETLRFYAARCPHLGCRINRVEGNVLVCPCHGSRYSMDGKVLEGPAVKDLTLLNHTTHLSNRQITVHLSK